MVVTAEVSALKCTELRREIETLKEVEVALETKALKWQLLQNGCNERGLCDSLSGRN